MQYADIFPPHSLTTPCTDTLYSEEYSSFLFKSYSFDRSLLSIKMKSLKKYQPIGGRRKKLLKTLNFFTKKFKKRLSEKERDNHWEFQFEKRKKKEKKGGKNYRCYCRYSAMWLVSLQWKQNIPGNPLRKSKFWNPRC